MIVQVQKYLSAIGVEFNINSKIVRGLDYYTKTVFEIVDKEGLTLCGGGRYDYLVEELGGKESPAVGFGLGLERLILALQKEGIELCDKNTIDLFVATLDKSFGTYAFNLCNELRKLNVSCDMDFLERSLKSQMKYANKIGAKNVIVLGQDEIDNICVNIKNMMTGENFKVELNSEKIQRALNLKSNRG